MNPTISSSYSLEITLKSAEELIIGNHKPIKKNVFVSISTDNQVCMNKLQTKLSDEANNGKPTWNEKLLMTTSKNANFVHLEVYYKKRSSEKFIGIAKVPTSDFIGKNMPLNYLHCLSYRLRDQNGAPNGIINFSVNVKGKLDCHSDESYNYREEVNIQGFNNRGNYYGPKPWVGTSSLLGGGRRKSSAAVVGVPAAWYNSCHA